MIGERIKLLRKELGMTQKQFADMLGTSRDNVSGYEIGRRNPSGGIISLIVKTFNVNETWLRAGEGEIFHSGGTLNQRMKDLRKVLDLTQCEFAEKIGVKRNTIAQYEMGRNPPTNTVMTLICREYNVNETWLRTGEGKMFCEVAKDDQVVAFVRETLARAPESFQSRFLFQISQLSKEGWLALEQVMTMMDGTNSGGGDCT